MSDSEVTRLKAELEGVTRDAFEMFVAYSMRSRTLRMELEKERAIPKMRGGPRNGISVQQPWCLSLTLQQQSVLLLACRGPDGVGKDHSCKRVHVAYRATVLTAAKYGRPLRYGETADGFMSLHEFTNDSLWGHAVDAFFSAHDALPHHYLMHLAHGAEIIGYKHPDERFAARWREFYERFCESLHVPVETGAQMDARLSDWERREWAPPEDGGPVISITEIVAGEAAKTAAMRLDRDAWRARAEAAEEAAAKMRKAFERIEFANAEIGAAFRDAFGEVP